MVFLPTTEPGNLINAWERNRLLTRRKKIKIAMAKLQKLVLEKKYFHGT